MRKNHLWITILLIAMIFTFVSCSDGVKTVDKVGNIAIGENPQTKAIATVVTYSSEVEDLYWYYKATKVDDGYTTGNTNNAFVPVVEEGTPAAPAKGLSGKILKSEGFSYGLWNIELKGVITADSNTDAEYTLTFNNFLVNQDMNYATGEIKVSDNATTTIEFGDIWFSASNITTDSVLSLKITDGSNTISVDNSLYSSGEYTTGKKVEAGKVTFKGITFTGTAVGSHEMKFTLTQTLSGTGNTTIDAAVYTLKFTVEPGTNTEISGDMIKNDQTGKIQVNGVQSIEPTVVSKIIPVETGATKDSATVKTATTIQIGDLKVTYPIGSKIVPGEGGLAENKDGVTSDGKVGFKYVGFDEPANIEINAAHSTDKYELLLSAPTDNANKKLLTVEKNVGKNLEIIGIYHESNLLSTTVSENDEYYEYNKSTGILKLHIFHASSFYVVSKQAVAKIGESLYYSLQEAIDASSENNTIKLLLDTKENVTIPEGKNFTLDTNGKILNGGTKKDSPAIKNCGTVVVTGNGIIKREDEGAKAYYTIQNWGTMTIDDVTVTNGSGYNGAGASLIINGCNERNGKLTINNLVFTQDKFIVIKNDKGELEINGGTFTARGIYDKTDGKKGLTSAIQNWDKCTINGGNFSGGLSVMTDSRTSEMTINGGTFKNVTIWLRNYNNDDFNPKLLINGGTFTFDSNYKFVFGSEMSTVKTSEDITITKGTFSSDPSAYVAAGYKAVEDQKTSMWTIAELPSIAINERLNEQYKTLQDAFDKANSGDTIKMITDYQADEVIQVIKSINLDTNGYTITLSGESVNEEQAAIVVLCNNTDKNVLTLTGTGTILSSYGVVRLYSSNSGVEINGPTLKASKGSVIETYSLNLVCDNEYNTASCSGFPSNRTINVKNGTLIAPDGKDSANSIIHCDYGKLDITGGTLNSGDLFASLYLSTDCIADIKNCSISGNVVIDVINNATVSFGEGVVVNDENATLISDIFCVRDDAGVLNVIGGSYPVDPSSYVPNGYTAKENSGVWTVIPNQSK